MSSAAVMQRQWDADFRDEPPACSNYSRASGCGGRRTAVDSNGPTEFIVPDLAELSDEEFLQRLDNMRREHQLALELCDKLGLQPQHDQPHQSNSRTVSPTLPVASVDDDYTISTQNYRGIAGDLITTSHDIQRPFKARRAPPRKNVPIDGKPRPNQNSRKQRECQFLNESEKERQEMREYVMEKYMSTCFGDEYGWNCYENQGRCMGRKPQPSTMMKSQSFSKFASSPNDDSWQHRITVPKPFKMTLRESSKPPTKSRSAAELDRRRTEQLKQVEIECSKKFRASPAPATIYVPLYDELSRERERRHRVHVALRQQELHELQRPFAFLNREAERKFQKDRRRAVFAAADACTPDANFKAKPFPKHLFGNEAYERMCEEEDLREDRKQARAETLLRTSSLPPNMTKKRPSHSCAMSGGESDNEMKHHHEEGHLIDATRSSSPLFQNGAEKAMDCSLKHSPSHVQREFNESGSVSSMAASRTRWPDTNVAANPLSRSMSDLLLASHTDTSCNALLGSQNVRSAYCHTTKTKPVTVASCDASCQAKPLVGILKNTSSLSSSSSKKNPSALCTRASFEAGTVARRWSAKTPEEERLHREIENDLKYVDL